MTLKHSLSFIFCLAFTTIAALAQSNKFSNSIFRFATRAEGQMLITELDDYTRDWNQFDIDVRLQNRKDANHNCCSLPWNRHSTGVTLKKSVSVRQ